MKRTFDYVDYDSRSSSSSSCNSSSSTISIDMPYYERILRQLQNEKEIEELCFDVDKPEMIDEEETINEIINLLQRKASIVSVEIHGRLLESIANETVVVLFDAIATLPNLEELVIRCLNYWEDFIPFLLREFVTKILHEGGGLKHFGLYNVDIGDEIGADIDQKFQNIKTLKDVRLCSLNLGNKIAFAIVDWLKDSSSCLAFLDLEDHPDIGPEGCKAICNALEDNFVLEWLYMDNNVDWQWCQFYLTLNSECNRRKMMRNAQNDENNCGTRDTYINNMIETSNGGRATQQLSMVYYWLRMKPSTIMN